MARDSRTDARVSLSSPRALSLSGEHVAARRFPTLDTRGVGSLHAMTSASSIDEERALGATAFASRG